MAIKWQMEPWICTPSKPAIFARHAAFAKSFSHCLISAFDMPRIGNGMTPPMISFMVDGPQDGRSMSVICLPM